MVKLIFFSLFRSFFNFKVILHGKRQKILKLQKFTVEKYEGVLRIPKKTFDFFKPRLGFGVGLFVFIKTLCQFLQQGFLALV